MVLIWGKYFFECDKLDVTRNCFDFGIIIFHNQLTVLTFFDFDHLGTTVPSQEWNFSINFFVPNAPLIQVIQGWHLISVVVFRYNSPHYLVKIIIKKTSKRQGHNEGRGHVRVGDWCCTNLIFLAKIFPDTIVNKSCICLTSFSTRASKVALIIINNTLITGFFKVPDTVFTELFDTGTSWKMVNWQTTNRSSENIGGLTVTLQKKKKNW